MWSGAEAPIRQQILRMWPEAAPEAPRQALLTVTRSVGTSPAAAPPELDEPDDHLELAQLVRATERRIGELRASERVLDWLPAVVYVWLATTLFLSTEPFSQRDPGTSIEAWLG